MEEKTTRYNIWQLLDVTNGLIRNYETTQELILHLNVYLNAQCHQAGVSMCYWDYAQMKLITRNKKN